MGPKSINFIRRLNKAIFIFQATYFKFGDLLQRWKVATKVGSKVLNISKIMSAMPVKTLGYGCEYLSL